MTYIGLEYDANIARHALKTARHNLGTVWQSRNVIDYPFWRQHGLARVARCRLAVMHTEAVLRDARAADEPQTFRLAAE